MKLLENKVCLVTGSNRGIGASIVKSFAEEGAVVYANARAEGCIDEVCEKLSKDNNTQVIPIYFDVTDESAAKTAIMQIKKEQGRLDVLVNNAGIMKDSLIGMIGKELMKEVILADVVSTGYIVKNSMLNEKLSKLSNDDREKIYEVIDTLIKHSKQIVP